MKNCQLLVLFLTFTTFSSTFSQSVETNNRLFRSPERKNQMWFYWGYNREAFSKSDIHFTGPGYDFTLYDVTAKDRQSPFEAKIYLGPSAFSIPQFNIRIGAFITNRLAVSIGYDHMKYVMERGQDVQISGTIDSTYTTYYSGTYNNSMINLSPSFLRFEHTNGLNYMSAEADYYSRLWQSKNKKMALDCYFGGSLAFLYPRSDVSLFNIQGVNIFHVAGWGTGIQGGIRFDILPQLYLNLNLKAGFISMPDVLTIEEGHKARQSFWFLQRMASIGYSFNKFSGRN